MKNFESRIKKLDAMIQKKNIKETLPIIVIGVDDEAYKKYLEAHKSERDILRFVPV